MQKLEIFYESEKSYLKTYFSMILQYKSRNNHMVNQGRAAKTIQNLKLNIDNQSRLLAIRVDYGCVLFDFESCKARFKKENLWIICTSMMDRNLQWKKC